MPSRAATYRAEAAWPHRGDPVRQIEADVEAVARAQGQRRSCPPWGRPVADALENYPAQTLHRMRLIRFKPMVKNALRGFATVGLPNGSRIAECRALTSNGKAWAAFPSNPQIGRDVTQIMVDGKKQYAAFMFWSDGDTQDRWSVRVVKLVRARYPAAPS